MATRSGYDLPHQLPRLGHDGQDGRAGRACPRPEQGDLLPVPLEGVDVVRDPLDGHGHVQQAVVAGRVVVAGGEEPEGAQP